ncbi:hypothetical protein AHIS1_p091 [Acaryochloris phage A-HIS1]|nr:hypothetical protein AHIS1_p091 [Acaryochloris phage A-HIS1]
MRYIKEVATEFSAMLTATQIATLQDIGLFSDSSYANNVECNQAPSYEALLWTCKAIFEDSYEDDECNKDFDAILEDFERLFPNEDFEIVCICLECA